MSEVKVNKVSPRSGTDVTLGDSGDTFTVPSGGTLTTTNATVNLPATTTVTTELKTNKISPASGTAFTLGDSGDTFTIPAGATITNSGTATGFGGGKVLQVVQTAFTTDTATSNTSYTAVPNFEVDITPSATSSKVLVNASFSIESTNSGTLAQYTLYKDDTTNLGNSTYGFGIATYGTPNGRNFASINYLDSPNTTSAVNYQIYQKVDNGGSCKVAGGSAVCTITAMEIGA